jgi:hypothetical protein
MGGKTRWRHLAAYWLLSGQFGLSFLLSSPLPHQNDPDFYATPLRYVSL